MAPSRCREARATLTEGRSVPNHAGEEIVSGRDDAGLQTVIGGKQPASQALLDAVQAVAGGILRHLHGADG